MKYAIVTRSQPSNENNRRLNQPQQLEIAAPTVLCYEIEYRIEPDANTDQSPPDEIHHYKPTVDMSASEPVADSINRPTQRQCSVSEGDHPVMKGLGIALKFFCLSGLGFTIVCLWTYLLGNTQVLNMLVFTIAPALYKLAITLGSLITGAIVFSSITR
jgi:hypothetical protein